MSKKDPPLKVEVPRPGADRPAWSRVGLIGFAGFVLGVAWPRVAGVRLGPSVPESARPAAQAAAPSPSASSGAARATPAVAPKTASNKQLVVVSAGRVARCADKKNERPESCGDLGFDRVAAPRLKELEKCPAALGLEGRLSIGFDVDFEKKSVAIAKAPKGKKPELPASTVKGVLECAARELSELDLRNVQHEHRRYTVFYTVDFYPPGKHPDESDEGEGSAGENGAPGAETATIAWDTALVRKEPKTGEVEARLVRGTRVKILGRQKDWYKIESGSKQGWVYRGAIGL